METSGKQNGKGLLSQTFFDRQEIEADTASVNLRAAFMSPARNADGGFPACRITDLSYLLGDWLGYGQCALLCGRPRCASTQGFQGVRFVLCFWRQPAVSFKETRAMNSLFVRHGAIALGLLAGIAAVPALAADKDPVVAQINGTEIRASAVKSYQSTLPPQVAGQVPYEVLLDSLINNQLVFEQAKKDGADKDPELRQALKQVEQQLTVKSWMSTKLKAQVSEEAIKARYDQFLGQFQPAEEVHARHVLTETEDQAKAVIAELKKGADFAEVAKAKSKDPSAKSNGGDLGFFAKDEMVPQFAEAAFGMKAGELSQTPVQSQFGWHVIKVEDRRMSSPPTFEQAKMALREQVAEETAQKLVSDIRNKAKVKRFDLNGNPLPDAK